MTTTVETPRLTAEQRGELEGLIAGSDTVELKLTVPDHVHRAAIKGLALDPLDAQIRQVVFFDTPDLALNRAGVVVRARRVQGAGEDSVVKLRPVVPGELPKRLRRSPAFGVEVDAMPGGFVCSGSMKARHAAGRVRPAMVGDRPVRKLFTKEQRAFYSAHAPDGLGLDDLVVLGPIFVLKLKTRPAGLDRRLVTELWLYPDGSRILELSTKCLPAEVWPVVAETRDYLGSLGLDLEGEQHTKTRTALEFFAAELTASLATVAQP